MSDEPKPGPDPETLKSLAGMLPSFIKGMIEKRTVGRGRPVQVKRPQSLCPICMKPHNLQVTAPGSDGVTKKENCPECAALLAEGCVAVVSGDKFGFVKSERLRDMAGQIVELNAVNFAKIEKEFKQEWKTTSHEPSPKTKPLPEN